MATTLAGVVLPDDLQWVDEFDWAPVAQSRDYSIGGSLMVQEGTKLAGRPVTLSGGEWAWVTRQTVKSLVALMTAGNTMSLVLDDTRTLSVMFRFDDTPIQATPVAFQSPVSDTDGYYIEIRLVEV